MLVVTILQRDVECYSSIIGCGMSQYYMEQYHLIWDTECDCMGCGIWPSYPGYGCYRRIYGMWDVAAVCGILAPSVRCDCSTHAVNVL